MRGGLVVLAVAAAPVLAALWWSPWFVTQDGPAHLYNAHILAASLRPDSPFRDVYRVQWQPLPNWAGHLTLMGLLAILPPGLADRAITSLAFLGFAVAVVWLRWRVAGGRGMGLAALLAVMLALNMAWLLGFTSFLMGGALFAITLGVWWSRRDRQGPLPAVGLAGLLVLGYFCHLVSLGLTVGGLVVLAATTPGPRRWRRLGWTVASLAPLLYLGMVYLRLMREGGPLRPMWGHLSAPWSLRVWKAQLGWVDPLSLASKAIVPLSHDPAPLGGLVAPVFGFLAALGILAAATVFRRDRGAAIAGQGPVQARRGWIFLALLLVIGGLFSPDTLGPRHGYYLPQRLILLGLVALVPFLDLNLRRRVNQVAGVLLLLAVAGQVAFVWDYARFCTRQAGDFLSAAPHVGRGRRIATLLVRVPTRFRANPLLHLDCLLGVGTGNIVWANYETDFYYFPVQVRRGIRHPEAARFERVALKDRPEDAPDRERRWQELLDEYHAAFDVLVVWGQDPRLDAISARWFGPNPVFQGPNVRVFSGVGNTGGGWRVEGGGLKRRLPR